MQKLGTKMYLTINYYYTKWPQAFTEPRDPKHVLNDLIIHPYPILVISIKFFAPLFGMKPKCHDLSG